MATWTLCLGSRTSLISMAGIRYEGTLSGVNTDDCTVALAKVRVCGTEGRPAERAVAPREEIYDYIIFRASEIKDLAALGCPLSALHPHLAVVQSSSPPRGARPLRDTQHGARPLVRDTQHGARGGHGGGTRGGATAARKSATVERGVQTSPQRQQRRCRSTKRIAAQTPRGVPEPCVELDAEFDFASANAKLDRAALDREFRGREAKRREADKPRGPRTSSPVFLDGCFYDKTRSFFDNISKDGGRNCRVTLAEQRRLNVATFGADLSTSLARRSRRRGALWGGDGRPCAPKAAGGGRRAVSSSGRGAA
ncbi:protein LSM14 homolog A-like [Lethenteron reissneri]|uniref:protein LSM14 homolog A-like n=1 Tax=Lethenteron reissneri TaxID=7753 RepID=UPI002AB721EA|nr:protein LSM14 homolog A-like [Lethenteron reissneri]XP_061436790.1 protein LSM14 homolog A-like [Lethenteron reissneri]XP_061437437.1 protein LSM14 homolog A-like [Lethenteron reissneri]